MQIEAATLLQVDADVGRNGIINLNGYWTVTWAVQPGLIGGPAQFAEDPFGEGREVRVAVIAFESLSPMPLASV